MKRNITVIAFMIFMLTVSVFIVIIINLSNKSYPLVVSSYITTSENDSPSAEGDISTTQTTVPAPTATCETITETIVISETNTETTADRSEKATTTSLTRVSTTTAAFPMDINNAYADALIAVPGIGDVLAERILSYKYKVGIIHDMDMLLEVDGIGKKTLEDLKKYFYVSDIYTVTTTEAFTSAPTSSAPAFSADFSKISGQKVPTLNVSTTVDPPERTAVNINTADADKLMRCLLITQQQADEIVSLRLQIGQYVNSYEILYCESISNNLYLELSSYLLV